MIRPRPQNLSTAGFTLLEATIVVALIGILAAIAAPGWLTFANRQRAGRASDQVLQVLRQAQADAKRVKRTRTVTFNPEAEVPTVSLNGIATPLGEGDINPGSIILEAVNGEGQPVDTIMFDPTGGLSVNNDLRLPITITVSMPNDPNTKRCVIVETLLVATRTARDADCD